MNPALPAKPDTFDAYAAQYEQALSRGLSVSGESAEYFAQGRIAWTAKLASRLLEDAEAVLDFGCGVGIAAPLLSGAFRPRSLWGFDPSMQAIARANRDHSDPTNTFISDPAELPAEAFDLAYCNGVFHHIPPERRAESLSILHAALRPGGLFAFWENNPWNPGTRYVMSRIPFDRDAETLSPPHARRILREAGFEVLRTDAWFLFPAALAALRPLEKLVHRLPLGAQYLVLARKPAEL
ncbi:MAG: methyltransferase domain-containing protein [Planctomycetota bacterium]